jgi:hypothetical protein
MLNVILITMDSLKTRTFSNQAQRSLRVALPDHTSFPAKRAAHTQRNNSEVVTAMHTALKQKSGREASSAYIARLWQAFPPPHATDKEKKDADKFRRILTRLVTKNSLARGVTPEYIQQQRKIAEDEGRPVLEVNEEHKKMLLDILKSDQLGQLNAWTTYLEEEYKKGTYPDWFVVYVLAGVLQMGQQATSGLVKTVKRMTYTVQIESGEVRGSQLKSLQSSAIYDGELPFAEINAEALARVRRYADDGVSEPFNSLYPKLLLELPTITSEMRAVTNGSWRKFTRGDGHELAAHVQGSRWCTAGEGTATTQLESGDFFVFTTPWPTWRGGHVPRIAIRMEDDRIAEIRGIAYEKNNQAVEDELLGELERMTTDTSHPAYDARISADFPKWKKRIEDMRKLTSIYGIWAKAKKSSEAVSLDSTSLRFLYEVDGKIQTFGYGEDPRVFKILESRDREVDLILCVCENDSSKVTRNPDTITSETKLYVGTLDLLPETDITRLVFLDGDVRFLNSGHSAETANKLIQIGKISVLNSNLRQFIQLPESIADALEAEGYDYEVSLNLGSFKLSEKTSLEFLENNYRAVCKYLWSFTFSTFSDDALAQIIMDKGDDDEGFRAVIEYLGNFKDLSDSTAQIIIDRAHIGYVSHHIKNFSGLSSATAVKLLTHKNADIVSNTLRNLDRFSNLSYEVADVLISEGRCEQLLDNLDRFSFMVVTRESIIKEALPVALDIDKYIKKLAPLSNEIAQAIMNNRYGSPRRVADNLAYFSNLSDDTAQKIIKVGLGYKIKAHEASFTGLSESTLAAMRPRPLTK